MDALDFARALDRFLMMDLSQLLSKTLLEQENDPSMLIFPAILMYRLSLDVIWRNSPILFNRGIHQLQMCHLT